MVEKGLKAIISTYSRLKRVKNLMGPSGKEGKTELCRIFLGRNGDIYRLEQFEIDTPAISREQAKELYGTLMRRVRGAFPRALSNGANGGTSGAVSRITGDRRPCGGEVHLTGIGLF